MTRTHTTQTRTAAVRTLFTVLVAVTAALTAVLAAAPAGAAPPAHVTGVSNLGPQVLQVDVYSPSMDRVISNTVLRPPGGGPAPVLYLLGGVKGGTDGVSWRNDSAYEQFFADKNVTVVTPIGGPFSEYTDWRFDDPVLGPARANQWQTYLTRELPPAIDAEFATTGRNAIAGLSMSAGPAIDLAIQAPELYQAAGAYSGCPINGGMFGAAQVSSVVLAGGGSASNMWGPPGSASWAAHDQFARAGELRGTAVYLGSASGIPGEVDALAPYQLFGAATGGGAVEAIADACTAAFSRRLDDVGVPHTFVHRDRGAHTWGLFEAELRESWFTVIGPALGA
ncbi:alpha/beta hydrolase [Tomitella gaofuii]|uniref:alpha/beta hydrolase n=1 Tax=Tomitella gaofuii TaxID=2760083 RepID=UPI0015FBC685|nr:alpha/beta hydrolase-fold protein [Tomitella gaofuii]